MIILTLIQEQAIQLIQQLPDDKIRAIITLTSDELKLMEFKHQGYISKKKKAFKALEELNLDLPDNFDADEELAEPLEEKYGSSD